MQQFFIREVLNRKSHEILRKATFIFEKFCRITLSYEKIDCLLFKPLYLQVHLPYILATKISFLNFVVLFKSLICRFTERLLRHDAMSAVLSLSMDSSGEPKFVSFLPCVKQIGYAFTSDVEACFHYIKDEFPAYSVCPTSVAEFIAYMLEDCSNKHVESKDWFEEAQDANSWHPFIFVQALQKAIPDFRWLDVVAEFDMPNFYVRNRAALMMLTATLKAGLQDTDFPISVMLKLWRNREGQLSWIARILENPDVFCFADYPHRSVTFDNVQLNFTEPIPKDIETWKSLDLVEILIQIADCLDDVSQVNECFIYPLQNCPELLALTLLQIPSPVTPTRREILHSMMPNFLTTPATSMHILNYAWNGGLQNQHAFRNIMLKSLVDLYLKNPDDQTVLGKILDISNELNALASVFNVSQLDFIIDLACLAGKRDLIKVDKWCAEKLKEHGDKLVSVFLLYLRRRFPAMFATSQAEVAASMATSIPTVPPDFVHQMLTTMQNAFVSPSIAYELSQVINQWRDYLNRSVPSPVGAAALYSGAGAYSGNNGNNSLAMGTKMLVEPTAAVPLAQSLYVGPKPTANVGYGQTMYAPGPSLAPSPSHGYHPAQQPLPQHGHHPQQQHIDPTMLAAAGLGPPNGAPPFLNQPPQQFSPAVFNHGNPPPVRPYFPPAPMHPQEAPLKALPPVSGWGAGFAQAVYTNGSSKPPPVTQMQVMSNLPDLSPSDGQQMYSNDVQEEVNGYFRQVYAHADANGITVENFLEILRRCRDSKDKREKEVASCMLKNLFDEYRFFNEYPEQELMKTGQIFGGVLRDNLVTGITFFFGLRIMVESLRRGPGTKLYEFGLTMLRCFKSRLKDYPRYCMTIMSQVPHFSQFPVMLREYVAAGSKGNDPFPLSQPQSSTVALPSPSSMVTSSSTVQSTTTPTIAMTTTTTSEMRTPSLVGSSIETLLNADDQESAKVLEPSDIIREKVAFLFNNLSQANLSSKVTEMHELLDRSFFPWLAQYLVVRRISTEANFHHLYCSFVTAFKRQVFSEATLQETFRNIKILLRTDKMLANFTDRMLLKNLGHWLGMITIGQEQPILSKYLDLKSLLVEAFWKGQQELIYVVPFTAKVLESCANNKIFHVNCPWTLNILGVLREIHEQEGLKLNLKFEIEVLYRHLKIELEAIKVGTVLRCPHMIHMCMTEPQLGGSSEFDPRCVTLLEGTMYLDSPLPFGFEMEAQEVIVPPREPPPPPPPPPPPQPQPPLPVAPPPVITSTSTSSSSSMTQQQVFSMTEAGLSSIENSLPALPRFSYDDIGDFNTLLSCIMINPSIELFHLYPDMKRAVKPAIEMSVRELLTPVTERALKVALTTTECIVRKDFALETDENRMRMCAHNMLRSLASGLALVTCREPLAFNIHGYFKQTFFANQRTATNEENRMIDEAADMICNDNIEMTQCFLIKAACERALEEIDKRLSRDYEMRVAARREGRCWLDVTGVTITGAEESLSAMIACRAARVLHTREQLQRQVAIYAEMGTAIAGFRPTPPDYVDSLLRVEHIGVEPIAVVYPTVTTIRDAIAVAEANSHEFDAAANSLVSKVVRIFFDNFVVGADHNFCLVLIDMFRFVVVDLIVVRELRWVQRSVLNALNECRIESRFNLFSIDFLLRHRLLCPVGYDVQMAAWLDERGQGRPLPLVVQFAQQLLRVFLIDSGAGTGEQYQQRLQVAAETDFSNTITALAKLLVPAAVVDKRAALFERLRNMPPHSLTNAIVYTLPTGSMPTTDVEKAENATIVQLSSCMVFKSDESMTRFFRVCMEMCIDLCHRALVDPAAPMHVVRTRCYHTLDAYVAIVTLSIRRVSDDKPPAVRINLYIRLLGVITAGLVHDLETRRTDFKCMPYQRLLTAVFVQMTDPDPLHVDSTVQQQLISSFCNTMHMIRPEEAPLFVLAWLEIVSHRVVLGRLLGSSTPDSKCWEMYATLLLDLFRFLAPFLRNLIFDKAISTVYRSLMRLLLVLLHDFPELLCDYHFPICDIIPANCVQLRNLIISAYPRSIRLPDPYLPIPQLELLPEMSVSPRITVNLDDQMQSYSFKAELDAYLKNRAPVGFLSGLRGKLQVSNDAGSKYNVSMVNTLVLYVGVQAIQAIARNDQRPNVSSVAHTAHMDIFQNLAVDLDNEGRYLFFNAIANQLRYPNTHTLYFSSALMYLFLEANTETIQEQITRVLFERLAALRPHPWGLLMTFTEIIQNPVYKFWSHNFVRCSPEVEKLMEDVARSGMGRHAYNKACPYRQHDAVCSEWTRERPVDKNLKKKSMENPKENNRIIRSDQTDCCAMRYRMSVKEK
ncbi:CCR4-NOT transcription complex subunit 1 [Trichinella sp. T9]|nr:CCR4-NOT transcription complex subunit 1 [Trichinella sp. T9]